jgi:ABC-2 type transport system permease protein
MRKQIKIYLPFLRNIFQRYLSYKANVLMYFLGDFMLLAVTYFLWKAIFESSSGTLNGFTFHEMVIYLFIAMLSQALISTEVAYSISEEVRDGTIAINLLRPINYMSRMFFETLGNNFYNLVVIVIPGMIITLIMNYLYFGDIQWIRILLYLISMIFSILLNFIFNYTFGLISFKNINMWGLSVIIGAVIGMLSGMLLPLSFLPPAMRQLTYLLPFASMIYTPTLIFVGKLQGSAMWQALLIQGVWILLLYFFALWLWGRLVRHLTIAGG